MKWSCQNNIAKVRYIRKIKNQLRLQILTLNLTLFGQCFFSVYLLEIYMILFLNLISPEPQPRRQQHPPLRTKVAFLQKKVESLMAENTGSSQTPGPAPQVATGETTPQSMFQLIHTAHCVNIPKMN
jgi:hypothetical protein